MLEGKIAVITGGANGIGKATALKFIENHAQVAIIDVDEKGKELCESLNRPNQKVKFYKANITHLDHTIEVMDRIAQDFGGLHILVNNAGITRDASMKKMTADQWQQVIDVNLTGVFNCTKAATPHMKEAGFGRIMNASSVVGIYGNFGQTNYVATKAGVIGMTKTWAKEFGRYNITVNAVAPGFIKTEMIETIPDKIIDMMKDRSSLNRLGEVDDIASAYLFLASDMASFITGTVLSVDGGLVM